MLNDGAEIGMHSGESYGGRTPWLGSIKYLGGMKFVPSFVYISLKLSWSNRKYLS